MGIKYIRRQIIGSFKVVAHLDSGGMADVYLAEYCKNPLILGVVKRLHEHLVGEPELLAMFRDEGRIMAHLDHPNVVKVYEYGDVDGMPFISMEYLAGDHLGTIRKLARRRKVPLSPTWIARVFIQVANGLDYVHQRRDAQGQPLGLVHRDISPQNIFYCYSGAIKILDFGIALIREREVATRSGVLKGKLLYMSPEQVQGLELDGRSDLFSIGVVLWETLAGRSLFKADSEYQTMCRICEEPAPPLDQVSPAVPAPLQALVMRCLDKDRQRRFQSAAELRSALSDFLFGQVTGGNPRELVQFADRLLGNRRTKKEALVASVRRSDALQEQLFGDLGDDLGGQDSGSGSSARRQVVVTYPSSEPAPSPAPIRKDPAVEPLPSARPEPAAPAPIMRNRFQGHPLLWLALVAFCSFVLAGLVAWWLWPENKAGDQPPSSPPSPAAPVKPGEPVPTEAPPPPPPQTAVPTAPVSPVPVPAAPDQAALDAGVQEDTAPPADVGFLAVAASDKMDVFVDDHYVGQTPVTDLELPPGRHVLKVAKPDGPVQKTLPVLIKVGEVSAHTFEF